MYRTSRALFENGEWIDAARKVTGLLEIDPAARNAAYTPPRKMTGKGCSPRSETGAKPMLAE